LWAERFAPLEPFLNGAEKLVLIPSWAMGGFPVEALVDSEGRFLSERYSVSYTPSATVHAWLHEQRPPDGAAPRTALLVADPPFSESHLAATGEVSASPVRPISSIAPSVLRSALRGDTRAMGLLPRLAGSRSEVRSAARWFPEATVLVGREASEPGLGTLVENAAAKRYDVVHIATHALVDNERPERSGLVLSQVGISGDGSDDVDGIVTGAEIMRDWKLSAELVTLSACRTALGRNIYGEGVVGLVYPFMEAGARSLLVSLWKVDDRATALLMGRFYERWLAVPQGEAGRRSTKAEALREAKGWLRDYRDERGEQPYRHPYFWSAFIIIGDGE